MKKDLLSELAEVARGPVGFSWIRQRELTPTLPAYSVGGCADGFLRDAILCLVVGMEEECRELLAKSDQWMTNALERMRSGELLHNEHDCYFSQAQCRWLAGPPASPPDLSRALRLLDKRASSATPQNFLDVFKWVLPRWLDAGLAQECVAAFERFEPQYPPARRRHHSPAAMAYLLARQRVRQTLSLPELAKLTDDFLTKQTPYLLGNGHYSDFARWVKLVTEAEPGSAARAAVREAAERYA